MELILQMLFKLKNKNKMIMYIGPESIPSLCSMIEKGTLKKNWPGCYSEPLFLNYFVTFSNHSKQLIPSHVPYLSKVITYVTHLYSRDQKINKHRQQNTKLNCFLFILLFQLRRQREQVPSNEMAYQLPNYLIFFHLSKIFEYATQHIQAGFE